ncbi:MAG: branched-chain amino acid ABC transporter permease [Fervidobacterium sp.]|uniref:Amino acid/amide ABC transporter membrane protein 2, HAAT family n=1 Tax=Fervidobacterium gondwanense DSM 13020 TaxID=1121883 RepID=A0A1M7T6W3_FERGO|nr:branched-chain amino acid ABC transporter permease [Fervidobacterium gondwanense]UXF01832.1 ABC transporter permease [Fervidobacterium riparium]SHN66491.1 amino acid/amide ABC transporter membrane protein 2, HAAT family [Fervidobacterium gondwanense DSM 13020]
MKSKTKRDLTLTVLFVIFVAILLAIANVRFDSYQRQILSLMAIYGIMAVSLNLVNGITGVFSLGHAGFILLGAYTSALLTIPPDQKQMIFIIAPPSPLIANLHTDFFTATIIGGLVAAFGAFIIGFPVLRLSGDYLAIASLGFSEVLRIFALNLQSITNGSLGLKGLPNYTNIWWSWGWLLVTVLFIVSLVKSSYGRALLAIRDNSIAAEAMGINVFKHTLLSFVISAFFAGVSGALYAHWLTTIDPRITTFGPILTYYVLIMVVLGGLGSISGSIVGAIIFAFLMEWLRAFEQPFTLFGKEFPAIQGMRMLVLSVLFVITMIVWKRGIFGRGELTWEGIIRFFKRISSRGGKQ